MSRLVTRRELINLLGATGGTAAVLQAGSVLGLLPATASAAALDLLALGSTNKKVAILGGGISCIIVSFVII